jgi:hypothetical protein
MISPQNRHLIVARRADISKFKYILLGIAILFLSSCNPETQKVKKFLGRINAGEVNASSKYVWPEDYDQLYVFHERFMKDKGLMSLDYIEGEVKQEGSQKYVEAKIKCNNCDSSTINYFKTNNKYDGEFIRERFEIRTAHDVDYVSLNWPWDESVCSGKIKLCSDTTNDIELKDRAGFSGKTVKTIEKNTNFLIDESFENKDWGKAITFENNGDLKALYYPLRKSNIKSDIGYFSIGWFGGLSILVLAVVAIICFVVVFPLLLVGLFKSGGEGGAGALLFLFTLIVTVIAVGYQFLENFLFEAFLINLPY